MSNQKVYIAFIRAARTFVMAFAAQLLVTQNPYTEQAILSAVAAGISALANLLTAQPATS